MPSSASRLLLVWAAALSILPVLPGCGGDGQLIVAIGTTIQDSGLADPLFHRFERETGYDLKVVAVGTGQALEMGRRGDADVVFTHAPAAEQAFVDEGYGIDRRLVMHNDFVIAGPIDDPAGVSDARDAPDAFRRISDTNETFISRGDDSGTHKLELAFWQELGIDPSSEDWYQETGSGMGATLQVAAQREAYTIADRGTYLALSNRCGILPMYLGGTYGAMPKGNLDVTGRWFLWTTNLGGDRLDAVLVKIPAERFGTLAGSPVRVKTRRR